MGEGAGAINHL
jgi:hypothetical protein